MSTCIRCQTEFSCGMTDAADPASSCWCTRLPSLPPERYQAAGCYCPRCLAALTGETEGGDRSQAPAQNP